MPVAPRAPSASVSAALSLTRAAFVLATVCQSPPPSLAVGGGGARGGCTHGVALGGWPTGGRRLPRSRPRPSTFALASTSAAAASSSFVACPSPTAPSSRFRRQYHSTSTLWKGRRGCCHLRRSSKWGGGRGDRRLFAASADHVAPTGSSNDEEVSATGDASAAASSPRTVTILSRGPNHLVASKPPSVVCHHSGWTGSRSRAKRGEEPEVPMLQRVRDAAGGRRVNLVHRLDRGASGCLLFTYAEDEDEDEDGIDVGPAAAEEMGIPGGDGATRSLIESMSSPLATKTYVALVRGEGILRGEDLKSRGWFRVDRPIKDERGQLNDATTRFLFVAGRAEDADSGRPRASIVLARPETGRWHQVRRHLNGLSHPILGDTSHGSSKVNREWKERRNMPGERTCLHLARLQLPPTEYTPDGLDVACPLPDDMRAMLDVHLPGLLEEARPVLEREGVLVDPPDDNNYEVLPYKHFAAVAAKRKAAAIVDAAPLEVLSRGPHHVVVSKPPAVVCHHSAWTGKRSEPSRRMTEPIPMLQRVRDGVGDGRMVNLIHRLDRGASGCLVCAFLGENDDEIKEMGGETATSALVEAMRSDRAVKTYAALVRGDGMLRGEDLTKRGWFTVTAPVKDENGRVIEEALTDVRFVAGTRLPGGGDNDGGEEDCAGLVLARPRTGRWHQIRQHLAGPDVGHPILGDSAHGYSRTNRRWKEERGMLAERCCLHLARVELPATEYTEDLDVKCPLPKDMMDMLERHMPGVLERAKGVLAEEKVELSR